MGSAAKNGREGQEGRRQAPPAAPLPSACGRQGSHCRPACVSAYLSCKVPCLVCRDLTLQTVDKPKGMSDTHKPTRESGKEWRRESRES